MSDKPTLQHFIITRFNIRANYGCKLRNPENDPMKRILEEGYLEQRFNIFEKFTLQSIKQQTNQNFTWLILFHKQTPKKFLERIKQLKKEFDFIDLYFEDDERFSFSDYYNSNEYYITTRIDNDDMIENDYIARVQQYANQNLHECVLSFDKGIKYDINLNKKYAYERKDNHFLSMIGKKEIAFYNIIMLKF